MSLIIRPLERRDVEKIPAAFSEIGWYKPASQYGRYLLEQESGVRDALIASLDDEFAGYLTVFWKSRYPPFASMEIPEITDLNVPPKFRRRRIASRLMDEAESLVARRSSTVGIGVGMTADYGAAQRLYAKRGYVPDGRGLTRAREPGERVTVNDELVLYLTKDLALRYRP